MQITVASDSSDAPQQAEQSFFFQPIPNKGLQEKQLKQTLTKWGLGQTLKISTFRFNQHFQTFDTERFLTDLINNPNVRYVMSNIKYPSGPVSSVQYEKLNCNQLSLQIFDQFQKQGLVKGDYIQKCMSEFYEGIEVCDKVRECLLLEESESYCVFDEEKRKELLFKLFQLLVLGGSLNQYEDKISLYIECTKKIYKSLVSVRKKAEINQIFIESIALKINSFDAGKIKLHDYNPQNFTYLVINPSIRTVTIISNEWVKFW